MKQRGRAFGAKPADYEALRVDGPDLYWNGKKLRTVGWTRAERLTFIGIVIAALVALTNSIVVNFDKWEPLVCRASQFSFCQPRIDGQPPGAVVKLPNNAAVVPPQHQ
jgi:hypothetical protein